MPLCISPPPTPATLLQERLHVVWQGLVNSGQLTPSDFVRVTSTAAAQVFNIYPRKGVVSLALLTCLRCVVLLY